NLKSKAMSTLAGPACKCPNISGTVPPTLPVTPTKRSGASRLSPATPQVLMSLRVSPSASVTWREVPLHIGPYPSPTLQIERLRVLDRSGIESQRERRLFPGGVSI